VECWYDALRAAGCDATWLSLPGIGIRGNSHALMTDDNNADIAGIALRWLTDRV